MNFLKLILLPLLSLSFGIVHSIEGLTGAQEGHMGMFSYWVKVTPKGLNPEGKICFQVELKGTEAQNSADLRNWTLEIFNTNTLENLPPAHFTFEEPSAPVPSKHDPYAKKEKPIPATPLDVPHALIWNAEDLSKPPQSEVVHTNTGKSYRFKNQGEVCSVEKLSSFSIPGASYVVRVIPQSLRWPLREAHAFLWEGSASKVDQVSGTAAGVTKSESEEMKGLDALDRQDLIDLKNDAPGTKGVEEVEKPKKKKRTQPWRDW